MADLTKSRDSSVSALGPTDKLRQSAIALAIIVGISTFAWFAMDRDAHVVKASESSLGTNISIPRNLESNGRRKPETYVTADIQPIILNFFPTLLQGGQIADLRIAGKRAFALRKKVDGVINDNVTGVAHQRINYRSRPGHNSPARL
jgi:hypothetical protein